ncbi:MAG: hypothetical protein PVH41_19060 [Anaerolineae bacterium]|jgi:hypothetical protein
MANETEHNERKFAEPRSWAGKWCGYALTDSDETAVPEQMQERKFSKPRGWAAKWCNRGLMNGTEK